MIATLLAALLAVPLPKALQALADGKRKDGTQILTADQRAALDKLPAASQKLLGDAAENLMLGSSEQLAALLSLELAPQAMEIVATDNCILCHSDPKNQKARSLFSPGGPHDLREFVSDVHFRRGLSCAGCHGGKPSDDMMTPAIAERWPKAEARKADRGWIPKFCARCHSDPSFMRGFNPTMPTDQLAKYKESRHGARLLEQHDSRAAQCVSCHGVHGIRGAKSRRSMVHPQRVPETCGSCHADPKHMAGYTTAAGAPFPTDQLARFKAGVHGKALLEKGDLGAPACNGCHGNHAAMPPAVASVAQVCRRCHAQNGALFDGSRHKKAFEANKWPECGQCHGHHDIAKTGEAMLGQGAETQCAQCHAEHAKGNEACSATAGHFRITLDALAAGSVEVAAQVEKLAEMGLDVEPLSQALGDLGESLVQSRSKIHAFDQAAFDQSANPGAQALQKSRQLVVEARKEFRFRRNGLIGAIAFLGLLAVGIALKLRQIERRRGGG